MRYSRGHARPEFDEIIDDTRAASSRAGSKPKRGVHAETARARSSNSAVAGSALEPRFEVKRARVDLS
jgi:hypothetical protein